LEVEFVAAQFRHHHVTNDRVVLVGFHLHEGLIAVVGDIDEEVFVGENPL